MSEIMALTVQDILAHQDAVQWPELYQVEQDLLLGLTMTPQKPPQSSLIDC